MSQYSRSLGAVGGTTIVLLALFAFVASGIPQKVYAWIIYPQVSYTPVTTGNNTTLTWRTDNNNGNADYCNVYGPTITASTPGVTCFAGSCWKYIPGVNGSYTTGPINGSYTYTISCVNGDGGGGGGSGSANITVVPGTACVVSSFSSPWNSNSYLIYSGGKGSISNWYGRYCVTNYSGSSFYIPMATPTEWNNFSSRAPALNIGIVAY